MLKLTRLLLIVLLSLALPIWLITCACECGEEGDDDSAADDDDAVGDDDDTVGDDDDTVGDDDDAVGDDDDAVGDDDDSAAFDGVITGTLELDAGITLTSTPPHTVGIGLFLDEDWSAMGPTGDAVTGISMDDVAGFPLAFSVPYVTGEEVWIAAFVDEDGSGGDGATSGDIVGFSAALIPVPSKGVTVTLIMAMP